LGAVGGGLAVDVDDLAGVAGAELVVAAAGVHELELLVGGVGAGPLDDVGAVGGGRAVNIEGLAAVAVQQHVPGVGIDRGRRGGRHVEHGHSGADQRGHSHDGNAEASSVSLRVHSGVYSFRRFCRMQPSCHEHGRRHGGRERGPPQAAGARGACPGSPSAVPGRLDDLQWFGGTERLLGHAKKDRGA
jgi:hypothetical protein